MIRSEIIDELVHDRRDHELRGYHDGECIFTCDDWNTPLTDIQADTFKLERELTRITGNFTVKLDWNYAERPTLLEVYQRPV